MNIVALAMVSHISSFAGAVVLQFQTIGAFLKSYFKLKDAVVNSQQINVKLIPNVIQVCISIHFQ